MRFKINSENRKIHNMKSQRAFICFESPEMRKQWHVPFSIWDFCVVISSRQKSVQMNNNVTCPAFAERKFFWPFAVILITFFCFSRYLSQACVRLTDHQSEDSERRGKRKSRVHDKHCDFGFFFCPNSLNDKKARAKNHKCTQSCL